MIAQSDLQLAYDEDEISAGGHIGFGKPTGFGDEHMVAILVVVAIGYLIFVRHSFRVVLAA